MSNIGTALIKLALLAVGATVGLVFSNWIDGEFVRRTQTHSGHDQSPYAQGLSPLGPKKE
jgi:hypothetical protein